MATKCSHYDFSEIEPHWQAYWQENKTFHAKNFDAKPKYYVLDMFPYPSGAGLHIGHPEGYTASDILARYKKARGFNVLHPMGWDAFGLPAEQHAVATGLHPAVNTQNNIRVFRKQIQRLGFAIDWDRELNTTDANYYRWTQWIFLQLFKHGLAYVDEKPVWWCPELGTVLANEEVIDGKSERGNFPVERRHLRQWVLRITRYAEKLLEGLSDLDWPSATKRQQTLWIGRSEGANVNFNVDGLELTLTVFTTRADTLFGVSYLAIAPEHPLLYQLTTQEHLEAVQTYVKCVAAKSDLERTDLAKEKSGVFTGAYALHPLSGKRVPIWVADYVLMHYGTGSVMAVPAHDERDFEFAKAMDLPVVQVIEGDNEKSPLPFCTEGTLINSSLYSGLSSDQAKRRILRDLEQMQKGHACVQFKLHDWLFSRQRYWGEPFPILWVKAGDYDRLDEFPDSPLKEFLPEQKVSYLNQDGKWCALPLSSGHLPVELPTVHSYKPTGEGASPLSNADKGWLKVQINLRTGEILPLDEGVKEASEWIYGLREINTMPQWAGSCWYYLRYLSPDEEGALVNPKAESYWQTPDMYIGGAEHAVLHLLYARFWHRFLHDIGCVSEKEPFKKLFHPGIILGADGNKMSKSRGNVVNPDEVIDSYGADTLRLYEMFLGPLEASKPWSLQNIEGVHRFLKKVWREYLNEEGRIQSKIQDGKEDSPELEGLLHQTIAKVTEDIENLRFNTAISQLMILINAMQKAEKFSTAMAKTFLQLLAPFAPHLAEEIWSRFGGKESIAENPWPVFDPNKLFRESATIVVQVNGKVRAELVVPIDCSQETIINNAKELSKVVPYLTQGKIVKEIYVPQKLVNFVVR